MTFRFFTATQAEPLSAPVLRSWQRCVADAAALQPDPVILLRGALAVRLDQHASLIRAATPEIEALAQRVGPQGGLVLLADAAGVILQARGDTRFLQRATRVALQPGVSWAEPHRGTNAIGTALLEGMPVRVHGAEHYLDCNHILSCHAAPIWSPRGEQLGVLDISADADKTHDDALGLATRYARQITNRMMHQCLEGRTLLQLQRPAALLSATDTALLLIEDTRIVGANPAALTLLQTRWADLLGRAADEILAQWHTLGDAPEIRHTPAGERFAACRLSANAPMIAAPAIPATPTAPVHAPAVPTTAVVAPPALDPELGARFDAIQRAFDGGLGVFLHGETGAGKEVYARRLHAASRWRDGPFVAVNCGALPESLIEAELFGYEAGAFTGARKGGAKGRLREADGGVLFLDEIGDMPLSLQTRLLRVLQERAVQPLGSDRLIPVEFGLISATHRDIGVLVESEQFRRDLFYRLHDLRVNLPPLRSRNDLRSYLCQTLSATAGPARSLTFDDEALQCLLAHPWPGNYRELQALMRTLTVMSAPGSIISRTDVQAYLQPASPRREPAMTDALPLSPPPREASHVNDTLRNHTHAVIEQALAASQGNVSLAARQLGVHRSTIYRHLERRPGA